MKIIDGRTPEGKEELERRRTAKELIFRTVVYDRELTPHPGQFIKWMKEWYKNIDKLKEEDFK